MRTANDPLRQAERLHRRLEVAGLAPQVVFLRPTGKVDFCPQDGARHQYLQRIPAFSGWVAGVFNSNATPALLAAALREVRACN